jgi:lysophospholipase L1-like esterase
VTRFGRYVALGDSTTEGLDDPYPAGGYRGWADRLAELLAAQDPGLRYANLGVRGRLVSQVRDEQLEPALAMRPDLATVVAGLNDLLRRRYDVDVAAGHLEAMIVALRAQGATVATFTLPDLSPAMPVARLVRGRVLAYNARVLEIAARTGAVAVDLAREPIASDPRLWSSDRLHANAAGHERIADAMAEALGLAAPARGWAVPLPPGTKRRTPALVLAELAWARRHLLPWFVRRARGRSSGDGHAPKAPELGPLRPL